MPIREHGSPKAMLRTMRLVWDRGSAAINSRAPCGMLSVAMESAKRLLLEEELLIHIISLTQIAPIDYGQLAECIGEEAFIFTLEEGTRQAGWGAEVISGLCGILQGRRFERFGAKDCVISCNREEEKEILPNATGIVNRIKEIML